MLIFADVQTTGVEVDDLLCAVALLNEERVIYELVNEGKKIPPSVSSIHHITNEMIKDKKAFKETLVYDFLEQNNTVENILIAHNVKFDLEKLNASGLHWQGAFIDTLKVAKHLIKECDMFSLQFLRYELKLYKQERRLQQKYGIKDALCAYNALSNVLTTRLLFEYLREYASVEKMQELSFKNVLLEKFTFGKYIGKYIEEIVLSDRNYIMWMLRLDDLDEDLKYSLEYYLRG